ncbi:UNVERIFIED_CONTAM: putative late blight resistance proteinR1B-16 [Sesamum calycinum]|uniref:Late blight resistance proteinR1B-16 n=1 Tax=Sesamum calycinum TaxID=2727403 RepID=A0AAW2IYW6_9LAMI
MRIVGSLPNLEILKLGYGTFDGPEWNPIEGEFVRLKYLLIASYHLKYWRAENTHFPFLEHLVLYATSLVQLPLDLAEIHTLRLIELNGCNESVIDSVKQIRDERESLGYDDLQIHVSKYYSLH